MFLILASVGGEPPTAEKAVFDALFEYYSLVHHRWLDISEPTFDKASDLLEGYGYLGAAVSSSLQAEAYACLPPERLDPCARRSGLVDTVYRTGDRSIRGAFCSTASWADTVGGILHESGLSVKECRTAILGSGNQALACRLALESLDAPAPDSYGISRSMDNEAWLSFRQTFRPFDYDLILNATPLATQMLVGTDSGTLCIGSRLRETQGRLLMMTRVERQAKLFGLPYVPHRYCLGALQKWAKTHA